MLDSREDRIVDPRRQVWDIDDEPLALPKDLELDLFDDEQIAYLAEFLQDWRLATMRQMLEFLSRRGCKMRICILDKLLNRPAMAWREAAAFYGVKQAKLFEVKKELLGELLEVSKRADKLLQRRRYGVIKKSRGSKTKQPKQKTFDL